MSPQKLVSAELISNALCAGEEEKEKKKRERKNATHLGINIAAYFQMSPKVLLLVAVAAERMSLFNKILKDLKEHRCAEVVSHEIQLKQSKSLEGVARE